VLVATPELTQWLGYRGAMPRTTFTILWHHDGARQLEVHVDADLPAFSPLENRVRSIASIATTHATLRLLLQGAFADRWSNGVLEPVGGVTGVHLAPISERRVPR
jgi:hypothetical protein